MDYEKIRDQQRKILEEIDRQEESKSLFKSSLFDSVLYHGENVAEKALGEFGVNLFGFASEIDPTHPDLATLYNGIFLDDNEFNHACRNLLDLISHIDSDFVLERIKLIIRDHSLCPQHLYNRKCIYIPTKSCRFARFAKPEIRNSIRLDKSISKIDLNSVHPDFWKESHDDLSYYIRNFNRILPLIEEATTQHERFTNFGLTSLAHEIKTQLSKLMEKSSNDTYYRFNKISMMSSAVILGRMLDASFDRTTSNFYESRVKSIIPYDQFEGSKSFKKKANSAGIVDKILYKPIAIPTCKIGETPPQMEVLLEKIDDWKEVGGKPIFDNLWVVLPAMGFKEEVDQELMCGLVEDEKLVGVLLGERDEDMFFVSYWM